MTTLRRTLARTTALVALLAAAAPAARAQEAGLPVGAAAPVLSIADLDGRTVDLGRDLGRRPVLLEFWATWCSNCEALLPQLEAARKTYGDRLAMYGINVTVNQTPARVRRYLERHRPPYVTLYDTEGDAIRAYDVPTTSHIVIVDAAGKVAYTGTGTEQDLAAALRRVFGS